MIQAYLAAVKAFTRWLLNHQKLAHDPLVAIVKPNPKKDRRRERRMMLPEEWRYLKAACSNAIDRFGMSGPDRACLYALAIQTGLRAGEIKSLTRRDAHLDIELPYILCRGSSTKNNEDAKQYITHQLALELVSMLTKAKNRAAIFSLPRLDTLAAMLREDLKTARAIWIDEVPDTSHEQEERVRSDFLKLIDHEGQHLDFHSLRHTCGAWLAKQGAHPKVVQTIMRHSTITLTMDTYGHLFPGQEAESIQLLRFMHQTPANTERYSHSQVPSPLQANGTRTHAAMREQLRLRTNHLHLDEVL